MCDNALRTNLMVTFNQATTHHDRSNILFTQTLLVTPLRTGPRTRI